MREYCRLGSNIVLQNGAIVGADGFGFAKDESGLGTRSFSPATLSLKTTSRFRPPPASTAHPSARPDRAGAKIDNLVQVGHGSTSEKTRYSARRSASPVPPTVGKQRHPRRTSRSSRPLTIGDGAIATAQSGIPNDVEAGHNSQRLSRHRQQAVATLLRGV